MTDGRNSVMETAKVYYPYLDVLKGIAIILMVMGHVIPWTLDKSFIHQPLLSLSGNELYLSLVYKIIYSFHMPLLFFVSGFLFYKPIKINDKFFQKTLTKRFLRHSQIFEQLFVLINTKEALWNIQALQYP